MDEIAAWEQFIRSTALHHFVYVNEPWLWPTCEILHYLGLSLLLGTVGVFDLRMLGFAKGIPPSAIHRLVPWGVGGYVLNVLTGILVFYGTTAFPEMKKLAPGADASTRIKVIAGVSLAMWVGVLICGRMLTWFRPPFFH